LNIQETIKYIYEPCKLTCTQPVIDKNCIDYLGCSLKINNQHVIFRVAKTTPTKFGQFVTLWKRVNNSLPLPFHIDDYIDFCVVNVSKGSEVGQFVFSKSVLVKHGVLASKNTKGKCAFRVYHPWDIVTSTQAIRTQKWQLNYFHSFDLEKSLDIKRILSLYS